MTSLQIEKFVEEKIQDQQPVKISLKTRKPFTGIFIKTNDYADLKGKNFWRIVSEANIEKYLQSKDANLARIYNGIEFTKLTA